MLKYLPLCACVVAYAQGTPLVSPEQHATSTDDILASYVKPVVFTKDGLDQFFRTTFNTYLYGERFLPACFVHVLDYLEHGITTGKPPEYAERVCMLFAQRIKEATWTNSYALIALINRLPAVIEPYLATQPLEELLEEELYTLLRDNFTKLQKNPQDFLKEASSRLADRCRTVHTNENVSIALATFLENACGKLIWDPDEKIDVWRSWKTLAQGIVTLCEHNCITRDNADQLVWTLIYRLKYFISCSGGSLPVSWYTTIEKELAASPDLAFLSYEEQDARLTTKRDYLASCLQAGKTKAAMHSEGFVVDSLVHQ